MSRYGGDPRYPDGNLAYRESPPPQRWDADRFARERDYRQAPPPPEDYYYVPSPRRVSRAAPVYEEERYYEDDRYTRGGGRQERTYYEEDEYYNDPRASRGQMVPFRPAAPSRPQAPPRPGQLLRRQSSLDTFDRPPRRYDDYDAPPPRRPAPRIGIPVTEPPTARGNRYRPAQPRQSQYYEDIAVQDPEYYGDDGFREYREREWISRRRRSSSRSRSRSRDRKTEIDDKKTEFIDIKSGSGEVKIEKKEERFEEEKKSEPAEKPFPRRGKTKMPKRRVHTKVLFDLGYPYYEENDKTIIIEKALGPDNIDEIFVKSKQYWEQETGTTRLLEAPPASAAPTIIAPSVRSPSPPREEREEIREIEIITKPLSEAPRSVREWDNLRVDEPAPSRRSRSVRSRRTRRSPSPEDRETIIEKRTEVYEREPSPSRTHRSARSRRRGSRDRTEVIERKIITEEDGIDLDESNSIHVGPLALVVDRRKSRTDRDIREEIARLQRERRKSRREFEIESDEEIVRIERRKSRAPSPVGEVIIERRGEEVIEVRKDKRGRMSLVR